MNYPIEETCDLCLKEKKTREVDLQDDRYIFVCKKCEDKIKKGREWQIIKER